MVQFKSMEAMVYIDTDLGLFGGRTETALDLYFIKTILVTE